MFSLSLPFSLDLAIADFSLFEQSQQQLSGRILNSEQNMLKTVTEILSG
jgi:hypothetical protein